MNRSLAFPKNPDVHNVTSFGKLQCRTVFVHIEVMVLTYHVSHLILDSTGSEMTEQQQTIGSSSIGALLGLSPWAGPWDVWSRIHGLTESKGSLATERGHILEPAIGAHYGRLNKVEITKGPEYEEDPILGPEPWMHARPDYFVSSGDGRWLLEIKSTRKFDDKWGKPNGNDVPPYYAAQCVWQMAVTGDTRCDLAAFATFTDEYRSYRLQRDEKLEESIIGYARNWHEKHIQGGAPPEVDGSKACGQSLSRLWKQEGRSFIDSDKEVVTLANDLLAVKRRLDEVEAEKSFLENSIKEKIGTAYGISGVATWGESKPRSKFNRKQFESEHPELAAKYISIGEPARTFRFTYTPNEEQS
tara:strand:+ start:622 stop:1695 length:1074 start_codon:yes stop_codon:yes gene_type:complete